MGSLHTNETTHFMRADDTHHPRNHLSNTPFSIIESDQPQTVVHLGRWEQKRDWPYIFSMPQHCFVAKQLNTYLFCCETLEYSTFCRETFKYGTLCLKTLKYAL